VVVVVRAADVTAVRVALGAHTGQVDVVPGRSGLGSLRSALEHGLARRPDTSTVLVHDVARALAPPSLIATVVAAADDHDLVVPVLPLSDTVKQLDGDGLVAGTADRAELGVVQGPWACAVPSLRRMLGSRASDGAREPGPRQEPAPRREPAPRQDSDPRREPGAGDAATESSAGVTEELVAAAERLGEPVFTVPGDPLAFPIATAWDLRIAELLLPREHPERPEHSDSLEAPPSPGAASARGAG
jgi:2-C-methyl-D-erythritol 4-phosphate cytidylyltransferase